MRPPLQAARIVPEFSFIFGTRSIRSGTSRNDPLLVPAEARLARVRGASFHLYAGAAAGLPVRDARPGWASASRARRGVGRAGLGPLHVDEGPADALAAPGRASGSWTSSLVVKSRFRPPRTSVFTTPFRALLEGAVLVALGDSHVPPALRAELVHRLVSCAARSCSFDAPPARRASAAGRAQRGGDCMSAGASARDSREVVSLSKRGPLPLRGEGWVGARDLRTAVAGSLRGGRRGL